MCTQAMPLNKVVSLAFDSINLALNSHYIDKDYINE